jgi:tetratricopeptide (TPR) repeat protein
MPARVNARGPTVVVATALAATLLAVAAGPVAGDDPPTPAQAIEKARALEETGFVDDAEVYLRDLVDADRSLARNASVLLELARLASDPEEAMAFADQAIERTRDAGLLVRAHSLKGDALYASRLYAAAAEEYGEAARYDAPGAGEAALRRADCSLAAGDASAALEAYREIWGEGAVPGELTPWAELGIGRALLYSGRPAEAAEQFDHVAATYVEPDVRMQALAGAAEGHEANDEPLAALTTLATLAAEYPGTFAGVVAAERVRTLSEEIAAAMEAAAADTMGAGALLGIPPDEPEGAEDPGDPGPAEEASEEP